MIKLKMEKVENSRAKEKRETDSVEQREQAKKENSSDFKVPSMPAAVAAVSSKPSPSKQDNFVAPPPGYKGEIKRKVSPPPGFPGDSQQSKKLKLDPNLSEE